MKTLLCFKRPDEGNYIGGIVTLCNDYIENKHLFEKNKIEIECFNYEFPKKSFWLKFKNSKITNIGYWICQTRALRKYLKYNPQTNIHIHTSRKMLFLKDVSLAYFIRKHCKNKILLTIHVGNLNTVVQNRILKKILLGMMNKSFHKVLFLSERMKQEFIHEGLKTSKAETLYNFYNINKVHWSEKPKHKITRLIFLGSINREKGIIELLDAIEEIQEEIHLDICGTVIEPEIAKIFNEKISKLGKKVTFHGYVDKNKKENLLNKSDILVLPSYREGLPLSILEAMATSNAIITTKVGAIPEILNEENGIFVTPKNYKELKEAIETFILNHEKLDTIKKNNFYKSEIFSSTVHISRLCQLYN